MPAIVRKGSVISFYGNRYVVESVGSAKGDKVKDTVKVKQQNGQELTLWFTGRGGCEVVKF